MATLLALLGVFLIGLSKAGFATGLGMLSTPLMAQALPARIAIGVVLPLLCLAQGGASETKDDTKPHEYQPAGHDYAMGIDTAKCIGCGRCAEACKTENDVPREPFYFRTWVERYVIKKDGEAVVRTIDPGKEGAGEGVVDKEILRSFFVPKLCNQCDRPPCVQVCPVGATFQMENGIVLVDRTWCIGCGYCVEACPYEARYINPVIKKVDKCDFCSARLERGQDPACVETCTAHAKFFGDLEDSSSDVYKMVYEQGARRLETSEVAIGPNVYYLGKKEHVDLVLAQLPAEGAAILLAHEPDYADTSAATGRFDLQLSGHTHHGQLWPLNYITRAVYEVSRGYLKKGSTHFIVTSGTQVWGPPVRTSGSSEIVLINVALR